MRKGKLVLADTKAVVGFALGLFMVGPAQGLTEGLGILPLQHLQTPVTLLRPNQHLVISINSAQSGSTPGLSQEKCQPLLTEPKANSLGIRFYLPVWASREYWAPASAR